MVRPTFDSPYGFEKGEGNGLDAIGLFVCRERSARLC